LLQKFSAGSVGCFIDILDHEDATQDEVRKAGIKLMVALFGGIPGVNSSAKLSYATALTRSCAHTTGQQLDLPN